VERRLFGTSGIRGEVDKLLTPELITKVTLAYATLLELEVMNASPLDP